MKVFAYIILAIVCLICFGLLYYLVVGRILFKFSFSRKSLQDRALKKEIAKQIKDFKIDLCWWNKLKMKKVTTTSFDGLKLVGHYIEQNSDKTVIIVHGFGGTYQDMQQHCNLFYQRDYNILLTENRAHGESEGRCVGFGYVDRQDICGWINFLNQSKPNQKIVLFGLSMGGTAVCFTASEKLPSNVVAIISDCAFSNGSKQIDYVLKKYKILGKIAKKHLLSYLKRLYALDILQIDATKSVKNTKIPILYIHGSDDKYVPIENMFELYDSTPANLREKYIVENAGHGQSCAVAGILYEKKIVDFIKSRTLIN